MAKTKTAHVQDTNVKKAAKIQNTNKVDMPLVIVVLMLLAIGIVMVLSASAPSALADFGNSYVYVGKQLFAALVGLVIMLFLAKSKRFSYIKLKKHYFIIYIVSVLILLTVLIPGIGMEVNGAKRWIKVGIQWQPSELTKIGLIIFLAGYFTDDKNKLNTFWGSCVKPLIFLLIPVIILLKIQNHMSAGIVMSFIAIVMIIMAGCHLKYLFTLFAGAIGTGLLGFMMFKDKLSGGFRSDRITAWLDPFADPSGTAYQTIQGLYAIGSGGLFGVGLGQSKQKYLYIPEAHNDFIFAILAEEIGFVGCATVLILFAILTIRGVLISIRAKDMFGGLMAIGITTLIATQAMLNIAVVTNSIPNTGISLPFLSYGGSSLIILLSCVGILLNISKSAKKI